MSRLIPFLTALAILTAAAVAQAAEGVRLLPGASRVAGAGAGLAVELALTGPVPWRAYTLADPPRLVIELRGPDAAGLAGAPSATPPATGPAVAAGGGWTRLEYTLTAPLALTSAEMRTGSTPAPAIVALRLDPVDEARFRALSGPPSGAATALPSPAAPEGGPLTVALDPGHGGIDPGAEAGGLAEAALMLTFARELESALAAAGFRVALTREEDVFVSLDARIVRARAAGADVFLSLHADALAEGRATGARVYTLSDTASDAAAAALAERHDRDGLIAGVDLRGRDDTVATVLMDLARADTAPRSAALADAILAGMAGEGLGLHKQPRLSAGFSVLRAPDIPSVLIELGFISSRDDRARLALPEWREKAARGITAALSTWAAEDGAHTRLRRQ